MTLPRRIQLVKLLRANGLRDVERMREDELKDALQRLRLVIPDALKGARAAPSSSALGSNLKAHAAAAPPLLDDSDDPWAAERFREPKLSLPDHQRTFLRAIPVKARVLFCTWDVRAAERALEGSLQLHLFWREFLGELPALQDLLRQEPAARIDVDLAAPGWYVDIPGERLALAAALVVGTGRRLVASNLCVTPPARPAPPGPLWLATLPPALDRRALAAKKVFAVEDTNLRRIGESDARFLDIEEEELPSSAERARLPWSALSLPSSGPSSSALSSSSSSSSSSSGAFAGGRGSEP